jgi:phosphoglucomutase
MSWQETYEIWKNEPTLEPALKQALVALADDPKALEDAFYAPMEFGTAGMRGIMGPGINRMNDYTVRQATEGLARLMDTLDPATKQRGVAISFDSRYHSEDFAHEAARVLGAHNIPSFVFDDLRPTPELSFAVRHLKAYAGIMITASHNPKQYNGYKIYGADGGQMPPKEADQIIGYVRQVTDLFGIKVAAETDLRQSQLLRIIGEDVDEVYLEEIKSVTINRELVEKVGRQMSLVYTPLHGTGKMIGSQALRQAGFNQFKLVPEQAVIDPEFPTVDFPNPEFPQAFDLAIALGKKTGADLLVATDPDADRLGTAVRLPNGDYQLLNGNQIASLMLDYILRANQAAGTLPANAVAIKSIVSTELATKIAEHYGVKMLNVLTGFKYIGEKIHQYEQDHSQTYMFGFEESYGSLVKPFVRDKDAIQGVLLLAEIAAYYREQGKTLYDGVQDLFKTYGYYAEQTTSETFTGVAGVEEMQTLMKRFREEQPADFAGSQVVAVEDFSTQTETKANGETVAITLPKANVLKYHLADHTWIAIRPSGTEPKIKFYVGTVGDNEAHAQEKLAAYAQALKDFAQA